MTIEELDRRHDENCTVLAQYFAGMSDEMLQRIIAMSEHKQDVHKEHTTRYLERQREKHHVKPRMRGAQPCSVCGKPSHSRGLCQLHDDRRKAHGDPCLTLRTIDGYGRTLVRECADGTLVPELLEVREFLANGQKCVICGKIAVRYRMCRTHIDAARSIGLSGQLTAADIDTLREHISS